jgi:hypothetical protein
VTVDDISICKSALQRLMPDVNIKAGFTVVGSRAPNLGSLEAQRRARMAPKGRGARGLCGRPVRDEGAWGWRFRWPI